LVLVYPIAILENRSVSETIRRSRELTRGRRLRILGAGILMFLIVGVISTIIPFVLPGNGFLWQLNVLHDILADILEQGGIVFCLVLYLSILRRTLERGRAR